MLLFLLACEPDPTDTACKTPGTWFADADGDGFGDAGAPVDGCAAQAVTDATDCDDDDATVYPGAAEFDCDDGIDHDCDGHTLAEDLDSDGAPRCTDCDEADPTRFPGATEACDGVDQDCDGQLDEDAPDAPAWYLDGDGDGYAGEGVVYACNAPDGAQADPTDCDDTNPEIHPDATEVCDHRDNDCDGYADLDATDAVDWFEDLDADGWTGTFVVHDCDGADGLSTASLDCDDADPATNPAADEDCAEVDRDCDGDPTAGGVDGPAWYRDADGDGYAGTFDLTACTAPAGDVGAIEDCDDADPARSPGATEVCGGVDEDCDTLVDDADPDLSGAPTWFLDTDGDGYAGTTTIVRCEAGTDGSATADDCDDTDATVSPGADEDCAAADRNCDGDPESGATDAPSWYTDADGDGYGGTVVAVSCTAPVDALATGDDCDDADPARSPGATEVCGGGDEDCDGLVDDADVVADGTWAYRDRDGDGVGTDDAGWAFCTSPGEGYVALGGDCDDTDETVSSGCVEPSFTESYDVVVVGSGPAGVAAVLSAEEMGATVLLIERAEQAGEGLLAGQGLFGAGTRYQAAAGISDSVEQAIADWPYITGEAGEQTSVRSYIEATDELIAWIESYGVPISTVEYRDDTGPADRSHVIVAEDPTTHRPLMVEAVASEVRTQVEVTGPVMWDGAVVGVRTHDLLTGSTGMIGAKAVVLATGGFQRDAELVDSVLPGLSSRDFVYECIPDADGGGVRFTDLVGAAYFNREDLGIYAHSVHDPYGDEHDGLTWYGAGQGIIVGEDGARFFDESRTSSFSAWYAAPEGRIYAIVDGDVAATAEFERPFFNWTTMTREVLTFAELLAASDEVYHGGSMAELAATAGIDATTLQASIEDYNRSLTTGTDPFGRDLTHAEPLNDPDWYALPLYFGLAKSFGGVKTDVDAAVLDEDDVAIPGLYAAGEVAGMIPGGGGGTGWGGSVSGCYYAGRVAGQEAASFAGR